FVGGLGGRDCSHVLQATLLHFDFSYPKLLNLACHRHWKTVHETDEFRNLEMSNLTLAEFTDLVRRCSDSRLQANPSKNRFAESPVRKPNDGNIRNLRMRKEKFFNLARKNVFSTTNQHFFCAAGDLDMTAFNHYAKISCMKPAFGIQRPGRRFG